MSTLDSGLPTDPVRSKPARRLRRTALLAAAALALLLGLGSSTASTQSSRVVVHGAASGSNMTLEMRGGRLVVKGMMARSRPTGCGWARYRRVAVCPLGRVSSIDLRMGPSGDKVRVLDRLPVPLTVYLGGGSDKFIGNGERDTCYPGGAKRNRCVGGPGDDICITGPRNSDCVGGPGNDYCQHGAGSDGCWGGPGRDICRMGRGQDGCHGGGGRDRLYGGPGADKLYGGPGRDHCDGRPGWGYSLQCEAGPRR